ncbi:alpha/beta hydrolase family protein [Microbacterium halotolerans]|uniref:alpha/beta hydrolase family protein n=1 Tax=Microbacterium halotolerans TaxID=246613 RepID=UPI001F09C774|nr:CocE/NonD family hydrolase [Microbacterium halotolerans]
MQRKKVSKWVLILTGAVGTLLVTAFGVAAAGNDYRFAQRAVQIPVDEGHLEGVLTTPQDRSALGLVVMVHGDGAVDATQGGLYSPWFEGAAAAGYATLSWSKPGVGGSTGNWLDQTMDDRAAEVSAAIDWSLTQPGVPTERVVLWGASQAGWVVPKIVAAREDIDGVVAVGTAINWLSQGRYNLLADLEHEDATDAERALAIARSDALRELLARNASYEEYLDEHLAASPGETPMTPDRWAFAARNFTVDATADLQDAALREIPVLLLAGEHDRNVDMRETETVYRSIFGTHLTVEHVDAVHSMARPLVDGNGVVGYLTAVFWPRAVFAPGVIDAYTAFLDQAA